MSVPRRSCLIAGPVCVLVLLGWPGAARAGDGRPTTLVGMHGRIDGVVLPAPELEVRPLEDSQAPFVLRIVNVARHGTAFRYDFAYYALEPRTFDLTQYLRPKDGAPAVKLPPLDNHGMGTVFEELIRRFNEENNEEAGEHFTPRDVVKRWRNLIDRYLRGRAVLRRALLLIDARHGLKDIDREVMTMLDAAAVSYHLVLTKSDKVKPTALAALVWLTRRSI